MRCPQCGERETRVVDSRDLDDSATIRRRRECAACATRFTTYERIEAARLVVVKRDGSREVPSSRIGALAMEKLRGIDQIAYIRFASVYQSFEDLEDLKREVDTLYAERGDTVVIDLTTTGRKRSRA